MNDIIKHFHNLSKDPEYMRSEDKEEIENLITSKDNSDLLYKNIKEYKKNNTEEEKEIEFETELGPTASKYQQAIELVKTVGLKPEFINNKEEQKIIDSRKEFVLKYFSKVLDDIKKYLSQVGQLQSLRAENYDSADKFQSIISISDSERRRYHNALIGDLKILIRQININFNKDFPEESRLIEEAKMKDREGVSKEKLKQLMAQREYVNFPYEKGIFINLNNSFKDEQVEREYIANWALDMYSDLTVLSEKITNNEK
ncbi:MAG TPA: hypothetical protein PLE28_02860 [bacterium]|nr:hypothetical protein [bacterium]